MEVRPNVGSKRDAAGGEQLGLPAASSHERGEATRDLELYAVRCTTTAGSELNLAS